MKTSFVAELALAIYGTLSVAFDVNFSQQVDKFQAVKSSNGASLCAIQTPNVTEWLPAKGAKMRCGLHCMQNGYMSCGGYNVHPSTGECNIYAYTPVNFDLVEGCSAFTCTFTAPCRVSAEAYGFPLNCNDPSYPNRANLFVNGNLIWTDSACVNVYNALYRGVNLFTLDPCSCQVTSGNHFDTFAYSADSDAMAAFIQSAPVGTILIGVTCDDPTNHMTTAGIASLAGLGIDVANVQIRGKYAFVSQIGFSAKTESSVVVEPYTTSRAQVDVLLSGSAIEDVIFNVISEN